MDSYMGRCRECSGVMMVCTDEPDHADTIADSVRAGRIVERVSLEYVRSDSWRWGCTCQVEPTADPVQLELVEA